MRNKEEYVDRLVREWRQHKKIIVAVDYDDTIFPWNMITQKEADKVIELLKDVRGFGAYITIFTASDKSRHKEIEDYCASKGLKIDSINENPIDLPFGKEGKIYYNIFLCDRTGLNESIEILTLAWREMWSKNREEYNESIDDVA